MRVLVGNAGSSTLKLSMLDGDDRELWARELEAPGAVVEDAVLGEALGELPAAPDVVAHRIVHGGERFREAVRLDPAVLAALRDLIALAPLHQPKSIAAVEALERALPDVSAVACFDTAFHATLPAGAATYALPREWRERHGIRRYGFHGLSHAYAARRARELGGGLRRVVTCHLGAGASLCAVLDGRSVDTTMGFTPLEGLAMATRSGSVDPGLVLWLQQHEGLSVDEIAEKLEHESGLAGLAGTPDMREVLVRNDDDARLALEVYLHRLRAAIGAMAASLGGLDGLVFTGGVGERSARVRELACDGLAYLDVAVDGDLNESPSEDAEVGAADARVKVFVVRAREDLEIARQARELLDREGVDRAAAIGGRPRSQAGVARAAASAGPGEVAGAAHAGMDELITIVLADDHPVVREGLKMLLEAEDDLEVVAETGDVDATRRSVLGHKPGVLVLDLNMPGGSSLAAIPAMVESSPATAIVVLTMQEEPAFAREALSAGAKGYVLKQAAGSELVQAVRAAAGGGTWLNPELGARMAAAPATPTGPPGDLTERELEVLRLIALGHTNNEIAGQLYLSVRTVETHRSHIQQKLGVSSRAELVRYALENDLIER